MRQSPALSVPVRWAAVTAVTIAASTGCMSISDDGGKPVPSQSARPKGSVGEPDGSTVAGTGRARSGSGAEAHSDREAPESPDPSVSVGASAGPGGGQTAAGPSDPLPTRGGHLPMPSLPGSGGPQQPPGPSSEPSGPSEPSGSATPEPSSTPDPEPSDPPPGPSESPAAQFRSNAMSLPDGLEAMRTPEVSPQVGPV
ncbi:hypothetical protein OHA88_25165 [Streptomyces sp. NBC_00353]